MDSKGLSRRSLIASGGLAVAASLPGASGARVTKSLPATALVRRDFPVDVTDAVGADITGGKRQWLGARLIAPGRIDPRQAVPVVICIHGGTFDKHYFDLQVPGRRDYSMAEHFARSGAVVVAFDMLGISDSSRPAGPEPVTRFMQAKALDTASRAVFAMLAHGRLDPQMPALPRIRRIGLAHSMGVMIGIIQQAHHQTFEQILLLGYSVKGVELQRATLPPSTATRTESETPSYIKHIREVLRPEYYLPDVPADVIAADEAVAAAAPMPAGSEALRAGVALAEAGRIAVPVFLGYGERDISPNPHSEVSAFVSCHDIALAIVPDVAHAHNAANGRRAMWDRTLAWIAAVRPGG